MFASHVSRVARVGVAALRHGGGLGLRRQSSRAAAAASLVPGGRLATRAAAAAAAAWATVEVYNNGIFARADADGSTRALLSWGSDQYGQLGVCAGLDVLTPTEATSAAPHDIVDVKAAGLSSGLLTSGGELFTFGCGMHGRLGHGPSVANVTTPRKVRGIPGRIAQYSVGENHVAAVTEDGALYTAGRQIHGSLGHDDSDKCRPARVGGALAGQRVVAAACGTKHTLVVTASGEVYAFGEGRTLALGQGTSKADCTEPALVEALKGKFVVDVHAGNGFSVARTRDGELYSWGNNEYGQLGQGLTQRYGAVGRVAIDVPVATVSCGDLHAVAVGEGGGPVFAFGCGGDGRTGLGNTENTAFPQEVHALAQENVAMVCAGGSHSLATTQDHKLFTWGKGRNGQLGQGGQLASVAAYRTEPVQIAGVGVVTAIAAGKDHSCVVVERASV